MPSNNLNNAKINKKIEEKTTKDKNNALTSEKEILDSENGKEEELKAEVQKSLEKKPDEEEDTKEKRSEKARKWIFQWYKLIDRKQLRVKFIPALILSVTIPLLAGLLFSVLDINNNPIVFQYYSIFMVFTFCLFSLFRRSKLAVLVNLPIAYFVYLIMHIFHLITNGWFKNPYGIFGSLTKGPIAIISKNLFNIGLIEVASLLEKLALITFLVDLLVIAFIAIIMGSLVTILSTGIRTKEGNIRLFIIPLKFFTAVLFIILLIVVPLTYAGISKSVEGSAYFGAAVSEFGFLQSYLQSGGGTGSQNFNSFDLLNPELREHLIKAAGFAYEDLLKSYAAFRHVQQNLLLEFILSIAPRQFQTDEYTAINTQNITQLLDVTLIIADIMQAAPGLINGIYDSFYGLRSGLNITLDTLQSRNSLFNNDFLLSVGNITKAVNNFTIIARPSLVNAMDDSLTLIDNVFVPLGEERNTIIRTLIEAFRFGIPAASHLYSPAPQLINATYKVILGMNNILDLELDNALSWMLSATLDVQRAIDILLYIDDSQLVSIEKEPLPFRATLEFLRDLRDTMHAFVSAGENLIKFLFAIENTMKLLDQIDFNASLSNNELLWEQVYGNVTKTKSYLDDLDSNATSAAYKSDIHKQKYYGTLTETAQPFWTILDTITNDFQNNTNDMHQLFDVYSKTVNASYHFSVGSEDLLTSLGTATTLYAENNLSTALSEADQAYTLMSNITFINTELKNNWLNLLKQDNTNQTIYGLTLNLISTISDVKAGDTSIPDGIEEVLYIRSEMEEEITFAIFF